MSLNGISTEVSGDGSNTTATKLKRRNDKLALAATKRAAGGNTSAVYYRPYHFYTSPGTVSPLVGHPWTLS
jgi:hypothetical protein